MVSWPATSRVISSSRSSCADIGEPSSWRASSSIVSTSSRSAASPRRSSISSNSSRSVSSCARRNSAHGGQRSTSLAITLPGSGGGVRLIGRSPKASIETARGEGCRAARPGSSPKTARRMISKREPLHPRLELDRPVAWPGRHLALGDLGDQIAEPLHLLAVKGGQHQLALSHVRVAVQQDHGIAADERLDHASPLAGMKDVGRRRVDLLHLAGVGDDHERRRRRQADREPLAVAAPALLEEGERPLPDPDALDQGAGTAVRAEVLSSSRSPRRLPAPTVPDRLRQQCESQHTGRRDQRARPSGSSSSARTRPRNSAPSAP